MLKFGKNPGMAVIEQRGARGATPRQAYRGHVWGDADERKERDFTRAVRDGRGPTRLILRAFVKKTEKTPRHEIDLALSRAKLIKATEK